MTAAELRAAPTASLLAEPHHDGSELYVSGGTAPGERATLRLRAPRGLADRVILRTVHDGEAGNAEAVKADESDTETWWQAEFEVTGPLTRYRWLLWGGAAGYAWVNGLGRIGHEVPDDDDFVHAPAAGGPGWHLDSVVYEIFPDRFASSGLEVDTPDWAVRRPWDSPPDGRSRNTQRELFGGDLRGIEQHLDHVERLGANVIYLTPIFPARSTHRYDATTFDRIDPLLGGDEALVSLMRAAHARGIRVIGDLTLNHTGDGHEWFLAAQADPPSVERGFYYFDESLPYGYAAWWGIPTLPKLNHGSAELGRRLDRVTRRWLEPPFDLDGWRIDVANMAGRYRGEDHGHELARATRLALEQAKPDALLVAEHGYDFRDDLRGDGWHGAMNYAGFMRPVWYWLRGDLSGELGRTFWGYPVGMATVDGRDAVATIRAFTAGTPWASILHSWTLLDSHDSARFATVAGSRERQLTGVGMQMTLPGVPMVFAGDEIGLEGEWGEDARRTIPWERPDAWDASLLESYRELIALRRGSAALARGGLRYAVVTAEAVAWLRETADERLLCLAARSSHEPMRLPLAGLGCGGLETLYGGDAGTAGGEAVLPADGPAFHVWRLED
ncbi:MAG: glycoside hydrolase family 13 protein [Verrucomicrobiota bacterium]